MLAGKLVIAAVFVLMLFPVAEAQSEPASPRQVHRYIIEFQDAPLASFDGKTLPSARILAYSERLEATSPQFTGAPKLDVRSSPSQAYLAYLDRTHEAFKLEAAVLLGRRIDPQHVYRNAINGMSLNLTEEEAQLLLESPFVKSIRKDTRQRLQTDAGPAWIGASEIWNGSSGFPAARGQGMVIGIIDSGINWDHPSFNDPSGDGYNFVNPYGEVLGLCDSGEAECNDKIVGVYDFVEDDPSTPDVEEENNNGKDNSGHGSHVAGIAAGNPLNVAVNSTVNTSITGVAPRANIIAYRVCYVGDPPEADGGGCLGSAILSAIDQAIEDQVDVINYSIGTTEFSPWAPGEIPIAFLNARNAGIFVATSGGNAGPNSSTVGSPANAPWVISAGNASHNRIFGKAVQNLSGGNTAPPTNVVGAGSGLGVGTRKIVHAKDYGFALCGSGPAESGISCAANTGASNPWQGTTPFNGEIVVCDRGTYGRVEKGKNLQLAGAGGYILANTAAEGESLVTDTHCLPAVHIGKTDGDKFRTWLGTGTNHMASISPFSRNVSDSFGDRISDSSSRGPVLSPVENTLKPNVIAPGTDVLAASDSGSGLLILTGSSMASPHIAGAAALLRQVHPSWTVSQVASALETTATAALSKDYDNGLATPHHRGAGRPRLSEAANAGLYLNVTGSQFATANPAVSGNPKTLNLSALVDVDCKRSCTFSRTVTDQMGGGTWNAAAANFPAGVAVGINPGVFTLTNGSSRTLNFTINLEPSGIVGEWVYGNIVLTSAGSSDQSLTVAVYSAGGDLPAEWVITDPNNAGSREFELSGLVALPDATFTSGGLVAPTRTTQTLVQDPTNVNPAAEKRLPARPQNEDPFDGGEGTLTVWHNLPEGGLWLHARTLASTAVDLDLYVGRDANADGVTDEDEQICESSSPSDIELCDIFDLPPGNYWIVVQNWDGNLPAGDETTLISAAIAASDHPTLVATGPGKVANEANFEVRVSWSDLSALSGDQWLGAVGVGTRRDNPNNIGVIPVRLNRNGYGEAKTLPLVNGRTHKLALAGNALHDRLFFDVPANVTSLNVVASGSTGAQNNALKIDLFRQDFAAALASPPFAQLPGGLASAGTSTGSGGNGPGITLNGPVAEGRYFVRLSNLSASGVPVSIVATAASSASALNPQRGLWDFDRGISQGAEWNAAGNFNFTVWYAYDEDGQPTWYIASGPAVVGNIWTADILRVTNDGAQQQEKVIGQLAVTFTANNKMIYSYHLLGQAGFDTMHPNGPNTCPNIGGVKSYTGHWYRGIAGLGGATVLVYQSAQAQVHYLYDAVGVPRWIIAADDDNQSATAQQIPMLQFQGFCATCTPATISYGTVGDVNRTFSSQTAGSWTLDFSLDSPLAQTINRTDSIVKLSDTLTCQ